MADLTFYTNPMSRGQIARWALHEAGADYEQVILDYGTTMKGEDYLAINPMGKVPAIVRGDDVVTECAAICAYLADAFPDAGLAPHDDERADYYRWLFFAAGPVEAAITNKSLGFAIDPDKEMTAGYGNYDRTVQVLSDHFADRDFVCGDRFTMADVYVGSHAAWGMEFGSITETENLIAYAGRIAEREAYQRAKEIDGKLIAEAEAAKAG